MKYLPYIGGVAITLLAFLAMQWLDAPWWVNIVAHCFVLTSLLTLLIGLLVLRSLPKRLSLTAKPDAFATEELGRIGAEAGACGFRLVSAPLEANIKPAGWLLLFSDEAGTFATFNRTGTVPRVETFSLLSTFDLPGRPGLATVSTVQALSLPTAELDLRQCFEGASLRDLADRHRSALEVVRRRGVPIRPADPAEFESLSQQSVAESRERFLTHFPFSVFGLLWRVASKRSPEIGPIDEQEPGRRTLDALERIASGAGAHPGPPRPF